VKQEQFLEVIEVGEAHRRFADATHHLALRVETIPLAVALGRVLADDVRSGVDVPGFDRSNVDGFAVRASDTFGAGELHPVVLDVEVVRIAAGAPAPDGFVLRPGHAVTIATGAPVPRGADAVVMVEHTHPEGERLRIERAAAPGAHVTFAGTDLGRGDLVLRRGTHLTSHETTMLAAVGASEPRVFRAPRAAIVSTGDEIRAPGDDLRVGDVYDANARALADAVRELGGVAVERGIIADDDARLRAELEALIDDADVDIVILSGGTSKGDGDVNHRVVAELAEERPDSPGIVVHGVALKPGKPVLLAVLDRCPVIVLPGFPTSAVFTFHEFVAPLLRRIGGRPDSGRSAVEAVSPLRIPSVVGRAQYTLVHLVPGPDGYAAFPLGAGSGSVSAFARADGFVRIPTGQELVEEGERLTVRLLGPAPAGTALIAIGSHCIGLDALLSHLESAGLRTKSVVVGSSAGLAALARGEGDVAGVHLLEPESGAYNTPFLPEGVVVLGGYGRRQGVVFRKDDERFAALTDPHEIVETAIAAGCRMANRNRGSGTRVLIDGLLGDARPDGHQTEARSHHAVAAAVAQGRADWGVTLDVLAEANGLAFAFLCEERFDIAAREDRLDRPAVRALADALSDDPVRAELRTLGLVV